MGNGGSPKWGLKCGELDVEAEWGRKEVQNQNSGDMLANYNIANKPAFNNNSQAKQLTWVRPTKTT